MEKRAACLQSEILWNHMYDLTLEDNDVSEELATAMAIATAKLKLTTSNEEELNKCIGGVSLNDVERYLPATGKLSQEAVTALRISLDSSVENLRHFYDPEKKSNNSKLSCNETQSYIRKKEDRTDETYEKLQIIIDLYKKILEAHCRLHEKLDGALKTVFPVANQKNVAATELLSITIEASLLKLSVVRARLRSALYDYSMQIDSNHTIGSAVSILEKKLKSKLQKLDTQEADAVARLEEYEQLMKIVDTKGGGFSQIVEDLARVKRETDECQKDLRRLGWTESSS